MRLCFVLSSLSCLAIASAVSRPEDSPPRDEVTIEGIAFGGSGCPAGSVTGNFSSDWTSLTVLYDSFVAHAGKGIPPASYRKNCQLNIKVKYPDGWQFSVSKADYRGYAQISSGEVGVFKVTYYFSGDTNQVSSVTTLQGPYEGYYLKRDTFDTDDNVWSSCGSEGLLNINSEVRLSPFDSVDDALITLGVAQIHYFRWQRCG